MPIRIELKLAYDDDVNLTKDGKRHEIIDEEHTMTAAPETPHPIVSKNLIVEILSPGSQQWDRQAKVKNHALLGVRDYWLVDFETHIVPQSVLRGELYERVGVFDENLSFPLPRPQHRPAPGVQGAGVLNGQRRS